jgi:hypothetical protein
MTIQNKTTLKSYFETGDKPTQSQFADLVDSLAPHLPGLLVAASNAPASIKAQADYVCDYSEDQVEIQTALNSLGAQGGVVFLSAGDFTLSAITIPEKCSLVGAGKFTTILHESASNSANLIELSSYAAIESFKIIMHIASTHHVINSNVTHYWRAENIAIGGGDDPTLYAINLVNSYQFALTYIFVETFTSGIRMTCSETSPWNPGNAALTNVEVRPLKAGYTGWCIEGGAEAKIFNLMSFSYCGCTSSLERGIGSTGMMITKGSFMTFNCLDIEGAETSLLIESGQSNTFNGPFFSHGYTLQAGAEYTTFVGGAIFNTRVNNGLSTQSYNTWMP